MVHIGGAPGSVIHIREPSLPDVSAYTHTLLKKKKKLRRNSKKKTATTTTTWPSIHAAVKTIDHGLFVFAGAVRSFFFGLSRTSLRSFRIPVAF